MINLKLEEIKIIDKISQKLICGGRAKLCEEDCIDITIYECAERCW